MLQAPDVHKGLGMPAEQSSKELRSGTNARGGGPEGVGGSASQATVNPHDPQHKSQRALDKDDAVTGRGEQTSAQDREPETATSVASERN